MKSKRAASVLACCALWGAHATSAETLDQLQIRVEGHVVRSDGGEQISVASSSGPLDMGKATRSAIGKSSLGGCGLGVAPRLTPDIVKGWSLEFTPTRLQGNAVSFHVRWTRVDAGKEAAPIDVDLTLRPGESIPIDSLPLTPVPSDSPTCRITAMTVRVKVDYWPPPERESRLVTTDLWLVEKAPDGTERTQQLTVRGLPNQNLPFYFSPLTEGAVALDIYGELRVAPVQDYFESYLVLRRRIVESGRGHLTTSRKIEPSFKGKPGEVVSVELPRLSEDQSGAFASKRLSLRLRSQQVR